MDTFLIVVRRRSVPPAQPIPSHPALFPPGFSICSHAARSYLWCSPPSRGQGVTRPRLRLAVLPSGKSFGRGCLRFRTASCRRNARFSMRRSRREQKERASSPRQRRNMSHLHSRFQVVDALPTR